MPSDTPDDYTTRLNAANLAIQSGWRFTPQEFYEFLTGQPTLATVHDGPGPDRNLPA